MAAEAKSWSLFDHHCFCEGNGVCLRRLFANEACYGILIGHQECIRSQSPHYQESDSQSSAISVSSNTVASTLTNESPRPLPPASEVMIRHSIAVKEARTTATALEQFIAIEVQMVGDQLRIRDDLEIDGAGSVPSLAVGDHAYYEIALDRSRLIHTARTPPGNTP